MNAVPGPTYALLTALCWAVAVILFRRSGEHLGPLGLNLFKNTVALVLLAVTYPFLAGFKDFSAPASDWIALLVSGAVGIGIADCLFFVGLNRLGAGRQAIVDCLYSPSIVLCAYWILGERLSVPDAVGGCGILLAMWVAMERPRGARDTRMWQGLACAAGAIVLMAVAIVAVKPILDRSGVVWSTTVRLCGGMLLLAPLVILHGRSRREAVEAFRPRAHWRFSVPAAVLGTYLALLFWVAGFKYNSAAVASLLNQTATVFIVLLAAVFLQEPLTPRRCLSVGLATAGTVLVIVY